jgi:hypothetical protein
MLPIKIAKRVAIVGDKTATLETEKEMIKSATLKFLQN